MSNEQIINEVLRSMGFQPQHYKMVDDIYYDQNGNITYATLKCGCAGRKYDWSISGIQVGELCDKCNKPYEYAKRQEYL